MSATDGYSDRWAGAPIKLTVRSTEIVGDATRIVVRGNEFSLAEVDRVGYRSTSKRINGAYMGTTFLMRLGQGDTTDQITLASGHRDHRLEEFRQAWLGLVDLLEATACPRIAASAVAQIAAGGTVRFGTTVANPEGIRARRPFAKVIPWHEVVGTEIDKLGAMHVLVRRAGSSKTKARLALGLDQWNTVVLPRVVAQIIAR